MKKLISLCLTLCLLLAFAAASADTLQDAGTQPQAPASGDLQTELATQTYFGKVKTIIGNELTLRLAESPFAVNEEESVANTDAGSAVDSMAAVMPAASLVAATTISSAEAEHMELTWLDEEKILLLPAGASITDRVSGQTIQMDAIKKGAVLMLVTDAQTDAVLEVIVWEQP